MWSKTFLFVAACVAEFAATKETPSLIVIFFLVLECKNQSILILHHSFLNGLSQKNEFYSLIR